MALSAEDRIEITELISLHGHVVDDGELERLGDVFTADITYDLTEFGQDSMVGLATLEATARAMGEANPVGHHVTNVVLTERGDRTVRARSKGIGIMADGSCGSVTYEDTIVSGADGWRISYRKIVARRRPLGGK
jgi:hypothetical protein